VFAFVGHTVTNESYALNGKCKITWWRQGCVLSISAESSFISLLPWWSSAA